MQYLGHHVVVPIAQGRQGGFPLPAVVGPDLGELGGSVVEADAGKGRTGDGALKLRLRAAQGPAGTDRHRRPGRCACLGPGDAAQAAGIRGIAGRIAQHRPGLPGPRRDLVGVPGDAGVNGGAVKHLPGEYSTFGGFQRQHLPDFGTAGGGQFDPPAGADGHPVKVERLARSYHHMAQRCAYRALGIDAHLVVGHRGLV